MNRSYFLDVLVVAEFKGKRETGGIDGEKPQTPI